MMPTLTGSEAQVEWAERIRPLVDAEFTRVASAFRAVAESQSPESRARTHSILAILEDKRSEVLGRGEAGYFIKEWQEINDQVRQMIRKDPRYPSHRPA